MIYITVVVVTIVALIQVFPVAAQAHKIVASEECDCGYNDPTYDSNWSELWHINFDKYNNIIDGSTQHLYSQKDFFFSNYAIPAKFNDSYARVFRKENVFVRDESLHIAITVENNTISLSNDSSSLLQLEEHEQRIRCGGFGTTRQDFLYGSFRSYMKTTRIKGTVAGMFLFHPLGEIDIELLSSVRPLQAYFAVHPGLVEKNGKASSLTHGNQELDFDPTEDFHEYRFDWYPGLVIFFIDGKEKYRSNTSILSKPSRVMFNHWTDGNPKFSQGPAKEDAFFIVKNMTFFFNSSETLASSPKCITANRTCNIDKIYASLKDKSITFDNYLTTDKPVSHLNPYYTNNASPLLIQFGLQIYFYIIYLFVLAFFLST